MYLLLLHATLVLTYFYLFCLVLSVKIYSIICGLLDYPWDW